MTNSRIAIITGSRTSVSAQSTPRHENLTTRFEDFQWAVLEVVGRIAFLRMSVLVWAHTNGWQWSFQPVPQARISAFSSLTKATSARCRAWRSMIPNHTYTRFSQETEVGMKWSWKRRFSASQAFTSGVLCTV